jgi:hypothetical protein
MEREVWQEAVENPINTKKAGPGMIRDRPDIVKSLEILGFLRKIKVP